jgi:hypothetical protein
LGVEPVLVLQADHHLVDQRHAQARDLHPGATDLFGGLVAGTGLAVEQRAWRRLAVVQPPITSSPCSPLFRQDRCTSSASVVTFLSPMVLGAAPIRPGW